MKKRVPAPAIALLHLVGSVQVLQGLFCDVDSSVYLEKKKKQKKKKGCLDIKNSGGNFLGNKSFLTPEDLRTPCGWPR